MGNEQKPAAMRESRDIEWLVNWALEKQFAVASHPLVGTSGGGGPSWMMLGTRVDGGRGAGGMVGRVVHEDAQILVDALGQMARNDKVAPAADMVFRHGRLGTQPDWGRCQNGRYVLERRNAGTGAARKRYRDPQHSRGLIGFEWKWVGHTVETLELMMVEWAAWHAALSDLRDLINPSMRQYVATGPRWPAAPWDEPAFIRATAVPDASMVDDEAVDAVS